MSGDLSWVSRAPSYNNTARHALMTRCRVKYSVTEFLDEVEETEGSLGFSKTVSRYSGCEGISKCVC